MSVERLLDSPKRVIVVCAGYHSRVVLEALRLRNDCELVGILDDNPALHHTILNDLPVLGALSFLPDLVKDGRVNSAVIGLGNIRLRDAQVKIYRAACNLGIEMIRVIHPTAFFSPTAVSGPGLFLGPQVVINTGTKIGENTVVYTGSTIDHDNELGDDVFISPGVHTAGQVRIERGVYIGPGAVIGSGCTIGEWAIIGAGSVVLSDIPKSMLAFGVPARVQRSLEEWQS